MVGFSEVGILKCLPNSEVTILQRKSITLQVAFFGEVNVVSEWAGWDTGLALAFEIKPDCYEWFVHQRFYHRKWGFYQNEVVFVFSWLENVDMMRIHSLIKNTTQWSFVIGFVANHCSGLRSVCQIFSSFGPLEVCVECFRIFTTFVEFWKVALTIAKEESNHWGIFSTLCKLIQYYSIKGMYEIHETGDRRSIHKKIKLRMKRQV